MVKAETANTEQRTVKRPNPWHDPRLPSGIECCAWGLHKRVLLHSVDRLLTTGEARRVAQILTEAADEIDDVTGN
jgi:hypothetical protein